MKPTRAQPDTASPLGDRRAAGRTDRRETVDVGLLAQAGVDLMGCRTEDQVFEVVRRYMTEALPGLVVLVDRCSDDCLHMEVVAVTGLDKSVLARAASLLGFELVGMRAAVTEEQNRGRFRERSLAKIPGGFDEFVEGELAPVVAKAVQKAMGFRDAYVIGITDGTASFGNLGILTREPDVVLPVKALESFVHEVFLTLSRVRADEALAQSEERHRLLFENMSQGFALHEMLFDSAGTPCDYRFLEVNPAFERITGMKAADIIGRTVREVLPNAEPVWIQRYGAVVTTGTADQFEQYAADLGRYYEVIAYSPQKNRFATIVSDITKRRAAQDDLVASEEKYRALAESIGDVVWTLDPDTLRFLYVSPSVLRQRGFTPAEIMARPMDAAMAPEDRAWVRALTADRAADCRLGRIGPDDFFTEEVSQLCKDGSVIATELVASYHLDQRTGRVEVHGVARDITERKAAEEALRESEAGLAAAQAVSHVGSWVWHIPANQLEWSDEMYRIFGIDKDTFSGDLAQVVDTAIHPDDRAAVNKANLAVMLDGPAIPLEYRIVHHDGTERCVWAEAGELIRDAGGLPVRLSGFVQDITERKTAELELEAYRDRLELLVDERTTALATTNGELREAAAAKSAFIASMSHELRTPLNSIIGFSGILAQRLAGPLTEEQAIQIGMINRSGRQLLALINDVLDLAKVESGRARVDIEPVDAGAVAREVVEAVRPLSAEKGLILAVDTTEADLGLLTDVGKLRQILFNLLGNAVKFTMEGSIGVTVRGSGNSDYTFAIADTGPGIPPDDLDLIFEDFTQLEVPNVAKSQGTGLGLRISQEFARLLGGTLTVASDVGAGSTFMLTLPARPRREEPDAEPGAEPGE